MINKYATTIIKPKASKGISYIEAKCISERALKIIFPNGEPLALETNIPMRNIVIIDKY